MHRLRRSALVAAVALLLPTTAAGAQNDFSWRTAPAAPPGISLLQRVGNEIYGAPVRDRVLEPIRKATADSDVWSQVAPAVGLSFPSVEIAGFWAFGPDDIYLVGSSTDIYHYNGAAWSRVRPAGVRHEVSLALSIWGSPAGEIYIATQDGQLLRGRGTTWTAERFAVDTAVQPRALGVWGSGDQVFVGTADNKVYHRRAGLWAREYTGPTGHGLRVRKFTGTSESDVWTYDGRTFLHSTGNGNWRPVVVPTPHFVDTDMLATAPGELLIPIYVFPGIDRITVDGIRRTIWSGGTCGSVFSALEKFSDREVLARHCVLTGGGFRQLRGVR